MNKTTEKAIIRVFNFYYHLASSSLSNNKKDHDYLFSFLNSLHSLDDKLKKDQTIEGTIQEKSLLKFERFIALKSIRNFFHHERELLHNVFFAPKVDFDISYELGNFIIISGGYVRSAINNVSSRYKEETTIAICNNFFYFNPETVNLYPCIFNMMVDLYQHCLSLDLHIDNPKIDMFKDSYDYESLNGINHFVDGKIYCHANNMSNLINYFQSKVPYYEE